MASKNNNNNTRYVLTENQYNAIVRGVQANSDIWEYKIYYFDTINKKLATSHRVARLRFIASNNYHTTCVFSIKYFSKDSPNERVTLSAIFHMTIGEEILDRPKALCEYLPPKMLSQINDCLDAEFMVVGHYRLFRRYINIGQTLVKLSEIKYYKGDKYYEATIQTISDQQPSDFLDFLKKLNIEPKTSQLTKFKRLFQLSNDQRIDPIFLIQNPK